jgi:AraC-like DNA-binding protein
VDVCDAKFGRETLDPSVLESFLIGLYIEGENEVWHPSGVARLSPSTVLSSSPGHVVRILRRLTPSTRIRTLLISPATMAATLGDAAARVPLLPTHAVDDAQALVRAHEFFAAIDDDTDPLAVQSAFASLVGSVFGVARAPDGRVADRVLHRVREQLHDELERNLSLDELAAIAGLSKYHLVHRFSAAFGLPPHRYHLQLRLDRARVLLRDGRDIGDVATELGFADQSHLTRRFTRAFGVSPGRYRARMLGTPPRVPPPLRP